MGEKTETILNAAVLDSMVESIRDVAQPEEIFLFGSRARKTDEPESDIDLLVVVPVSDEARLHRRQLTARIYRRLVEFPFPKDILVYTRDEFERWRDTPGHVIATALKEGRRLYGKP